MFQSSLDANHIEPPEVEPTPDHLPADIPADDTEKSQARPFIPWKEEPLPREARSMLQHQTIIKKKHVKQGKPKTITPEMPLSMKLPELPASLELEEVEVTPIVEGDRVVGIQVVCHCGATHEIRFEYDEP